MRLTEGLGLDESDIPARPISHWRLSARVEDHLFNTKNETVGIRVILWALLAVATVYILAFLRRSDLSEDAVWILHLKAYFVSAVLDSALFYIYYRMLNHLHLGPGLKRLKHKLPDDSAVPVRITVTQRAVVTGIDEGYAWFQEGTLFYKGRQTTFRLNRDDIPATSLWAKKDRPNLRLNKMPEVLPIPYKDTDLHIRYTILDSQEDFGTRRQASHFYNSLVNWLSTRPEGSWESLLPPTDLHPGFRPDTRQAKEPVIAGAILCAVNLAIVVLMNVGINYRSSATPFVAICTILHLVLLYFSLRLFLTAMHSYRVRSHLAQNPEII